MRLDRFQPPTESASPFAVLAGEDTEDALCVDCGAVFQREDDREEFCPRCADQADRDQDR